MNKRGFSIIIIYIYILRSRAMAHELNLCRSRFFRAFCSFYNKMGTYTFQQIYFAGKKNPQGVQLPFWGLDPGQNNAWNPWSTPTTQTSECVSSLVSRMRICRVRACMISSKMHLFSVWEYIYLRGTSAKQDNENNEAQLIMGFFLGGRVANTEKRLGKEWTLNVFRSCTPREHFQKQTVA